MRWVTYKNNMSYENDYIVYSLGIQNNENSPHELPVESEQLTVGLYTFSKQYLQVKTNNYNKEAMASKQYWREKYNDKDFPQNVRNTMK